MVRVLLTGGSGFIATHILEQLLQNGHHVTTTVRSQEKADKIRRAYPDHAAKLATCLVEDIAVEGAFDEAVKSDPPFEAVIHTASPYHLDTSDVENHFLKPAIMGTKGILASIRDHAPRVRRVVITSSFAAMVDPFKGDWPGHIYSEEDWSPMTRELALQYPEHGYRASKTVAEQTAWQFLEKERPTFTITTICPPLVFGPINHTLQSLDSLNTSNLIFRDLVQGKYRSSDLPVSRAITWVDVRDVARAHLRALDLEDAANKRFFVVGGYFSNQAIIQLIRHNFPAFSDNLPSEEASAKYSAPTESERYGIDNARSRTILGLTYTSLEDCVTDTVKSLIT